MAVVGVERVAFGEVSTAVNEDLHTATQLARSMVTSFGMSSLGPVTIAIAAAVMFRDRLTGGQFVGILISLTGVTVIITKFEPKERVY